MMQFAAESGRPRVAHLIESDGPGGAERVVADLATSLQAAGGENVVFLPARGEGWLARQLAGSGVAIEYFQLDKPVSPACARALAAAFRRHRISVAHSHEFSMAVYGAWASWLAGVQHVITMHGSRYYARRLRRRIAMRTAVALSGRTVAVSNLLADEISRDLLVPRERLVMIANGVRHSPAGPSGIREELRLGPCDRLVVSVGNLYPVKGHQHLVDAMALLTDPHPAVHLAIAGRGDLADVLTARARERGLADRVHLLGLRSDVSAVLAAADVFVMPSLSEGLPLALLEAMFAGCPIVASDVGEVGAALAHGDAGVLVEPGNPPQLAAAVSDLLANPARARSFGDRALRRATEVYTVSNMVACYSDIYRELTARTPPVRKPADRRSGDRRSPIIDHPIL
jgi:glycosyltransferase involved in cell wall biosynthesis